MELLAETLNKPTKTIYKHNIVSKLESAIRASNARFDDMEFLNRLDVEFLHNSGSRMGEDVFTLTYLVDSPLSTVFS